MTNSHTRTDCRLCGSEQLDLVIPITSTPVADAYVSADELDVEQPCFALDLYRCQTCNHVQLREVIDPEILFRHYTYHSGRSPQMMKHFEEYAAHVMTSTNLPKDSLVVDVGSNDGAFLKCFQDAGMKVLGIDPAENIAAAANEAGIETLPEFLTSELAKQIVSERGRAHVVAANNVFAHNDDLNGMASAIREMLADDGVFVFEVSYLVDVIQKGLLGTVFHEHLCYHSVTPLIPFLRQNGLELIDVQHVDIQGGSIIGMAQPIGGPRAVEESVAQFVKLEDDTNVHNVEVLSTFSDRLDRARTDFQEIFAGVSPDNVSLAGFGAGRHSTLLIHHLGMGKMLSSLVDDSPDKQGKFSPGFHIPVRPTDSLYSDRPENVVILAWTYAEPIMKQHHRYLEEGGRFITCFPEVRLFDQKNA